MMNKPLKQAVNDYLQGFELSPQQLASLKTRCEPPTSPITRARWLQSLVASLLLAVVLVAGYSSYSNYQDDAMITAISKEVTQNHANLKPLEVRGNQLERVRSYFDKLNFLPSDTQVTAQLSHALIGGRYCSIQGHTAAQLRIQENDGVVSTLFETEFDPDTFDMLPVLEQGRKPLIRNMDGYQVKLWVENGIVMALVSPLK